MFSGIILWVFYASLNAELFPDWTGFNTRDIGGTSYPARTLWDWLSLLLVPVVLAIGGILFTWFENRQTRAIEHERVSENRRVEHERSQDLLIKDYLDQMTELLLTRGLRTSLEGDEVRSVARVRTLTVLRGIDGIRQETIVRFLYESGLIGYVDDEDHVSSIMSLRGADLRDISLNTAELPGVDFQGVYLGGTDLRKANFHQSNFRNAGLYGAHCGRAFFVGANLRGSDLREANLHGANLRGADLSTSDLRGAKLHKADLREANFSKARLGHARLLNCKITGANFMDASFEETDFTGSDLVNVNGIDVDQLTYIKHPKNEQDLMH